MPGTTPTSIVKRLTGDEAFTDPLNWGSAAQALPANSTIGGLVPNGAPIVVNASTLTLDPTTHGNRLVVLSGTTANAGVAITPPAATGTGNRYTIVFGSSVTSNSTTIDAKAGNASDVFYGWLETYKATTFTQYITASNSNLLTFDGSTKGGIKGDIVELIDVATNVWIVRGFTNQTGTIASPFSNH